MGNYEKMYFSLFNAITNVVKSITAVQCLDEENFLKLLVAKQELMTAQIETEDMFIENE